MPLFRLETAGAIEVNVMAAPSLGEMRFAHLLLTTERMPRRRRTSPTLRRFFESAVVLTFVFFLFM